jgi:hypothetical protein
VATVGGNLKASTKIFKDSITNKTSWLLTLGIFSAEVGVLTYQRFMSKSITDEMFKTKIKASFLSNVAGVAGGSLGAGIGAFLGNLIAPGIGGYVGSLIGGFFLSEGAAFGVDYMIDSSSYTIASFEAENVTDAEKHKSYMIACDTIGVSPAASRDKIKQATNLQYKRFHPDNHATESPQEIEYYQNKFVQINISYKFIAQYR